MKKYSWGFWALFLAIVWFFSVCQVRHSARKLFWEDEQFSFENAIRNQSTIETVLKGALEQASSAPLDYVFVKMFDAVHKRVRYFGLAPLSYFRLSSLCASIAAAFLVGFFAWRAALREKDSRSPFPLILIVYALFTFLFTAQTYFYSSEMRPYALWSALWFLIGALFLYHPEKRGWIFTVCILLGLTASATIFQLFALGVAYLVLFTIIGDSWKKNFKDALLLFFPPFLVALRYALIMRQYDYVLGDDQTWGFFLRYMITNEHVPTLTVLAIVLCFLNRETRKNATPSLALLILYLMGPLIFMTTRSRGMFFADRQYIYYSTAIPFFFLITAKNYPVLMRNFSKATYRPAFVIGLCFLMLASYGGYFHKRMMTAKEHFLLKQPFGFIKDDQGLLAKTLTEEIPAGFCMNLNQYTSDMRLGMNLFLEWLPIVYREKSVGNQLVFVEPQANRPAVIEVSNRACPDDNMIPVVR